MRRLSLNARLALLFTFIVIFCLAVVGFILFDALSDQVYAQDDLSVVLSARHLRRLAAEMDDIAAVREHQARLEAITTADYPTPARRPRNSVLDCSKIHARFGIGQPDWRTSLDRVLTEIAEKGSSQ